MNWLFSLFRSKKSCKNKSSKKKASKKVTRKNYKRGG